MGGTISDKATQEKYRTSLREHNEGLERYLPKYKVRNSVYRPKCDRGTGGIPRNRGAEARYLQIVWKFGYKESNGTGWSVRLDTKGV